MKSAISMGFLFFLCWGALFNPLIVAAQSSGVTGSEMKNSSKPDITIHYLGHASFILRFDNGISILTDYGVSKAYGLDSPIHAIGNFKPTIVTYSHRDADHDRGVRFEDAQVLTKLDSLKVHGIEIRPILTTERRSEDNTSYVITYKNFTIVHLGDMQGNISRIDQEAERQHLKVIFPENIDLLLVPIDWTRDIIRPAEALIDLLQPQRAIPMHYWSGQVKQNFLSFLKNQNETAKKSYQIHENRDAVYAIYACDNKATPVQVISLEPAPFLSGKGDEQQ